MKCRLLVVMLTMAGFAQVSLAGNAPDPLSVGAEQGVYDTCSQADPGRAPRYQEQSKNLYRGLSAQAVAALRSDQKFTVARDALHTILATFARPDLVRACQDLLQAGNGHPDAIQDPIKRPDDDHPGD